MNPTLQSGTHPDAESLTAFAEQLLSGAERDQIMAHMAVCSRCREVVFLAQQAAEAEEPIPVVMRQEAGYASSLRWFSGWRWAWIPVAALAGFIGVAVVQHERHTRFVAEQQVSQLIPEAAPVQNAQTAKSAESPAPAQQQASKQLSANVMMNELTAARKKEDQSALRDERALDAKKAVADAQKDVKAAGGSFGAAGSQGLTGGAVHGMVAARAKAPSMGGPAALNQQNLDQYQQQNNTLQSINGALKTQQANNSLHLEAARQAPSPVPVNKPAAPPPLGAMNETVSVQAEPLVPVSSAAATAPAPQISPIQTRGFGIAADQLAKVKREKLSLPGGAEALSVASAGRRSIALDTKGALFLSQDGGRHWQAVKTQWTGRAILVKTRQTTLHGAALSMNEQPQFQLVTDALQTWLSPDGTTWTLEPPAVN